MPDEAAVGHPESLSPGVALAPPMSPLAAVLGGGGSAPVSPQGRRAPAASSARSPLDGAPLAAAEQPCRAISFAEAPRPPQGYQSWLSRAGLYAIFATQSNDFALGLPLIQAIWGAEMAIVVFLVAPFQLGILNPLAFALMEWGAADADAATDAPAAAGPAAAAAAAAAGTSSCTSSINSATAALLPADARAAATAAATAATAAAPPRRATGAGLAGAGLAGARLTGAGRAWRVLRRVIRSPLVASVLVGLAVRLALWLSGPQAAMPSAVQGIFKPLQEAFTATALVTLGLSLDPQLRLLAHRPTSSACLLFGKVRAHHYRH